MAVPTTLSRQYEAQQIIRNCLQRLQQLLQGNRAGVFHHALMASGLTEEGLQENSQLSLTMLDQVLFHVRQKLPGITLELFSSLALLDLGLVGYAAANADTVGHALRIVNNYHELTSDRFRPLLEKEGDIAHIVPVVVPSFSHEFMDIAEDHLAGSWNLLCQLLGPRAKTTEIQVKLAFSVPPYRDVYDRVFSGKARFDEERTELIFPSAWLDHPVVTANPEMAELASTVCERLLGPASRETDTVASVRTLLLSRTTRAMLRVEAAARALNLSPEQLRKRLWRQGSSYKSLVLESRMMLAKNYLEATTLTVQEIAYLLDYSQPGAFSRAFKNYCGVAPISFRESAQERHGSSMEGLL